MLWSLLLCRFWSLQGLGDLVGQLSGAGRVCHTRAWPSSLQSSQTLPSTVSPELWFLSCRAQASVHVCAGVSLRRYRAGSVCIHVSAILIKGVPQAAEEGTHLPRAPL